MTKADKPTKRVSTSLRPSRAAAGPSGRKRTTGDEIDLHAGDVIGWAIFTRNGGEVIEQVSERGIEIAVGPSETRPQMRVRYSPADAGGLEEDERFLFSDAKQQLAQIRALTMCGATFSLVSDVYEIVIDRHPECPHDLIDKVLDGMFAERRDQRDLRQDRLARRTYKLVKGLVGDIEERTRREANEQLELRENLSEAVRKALDMAITDQERVVLRRLTPGGVLSPDDFHRSLITLVERLDWNRLTEAERDWLKSAGIAEGGKALLAERFKPTEHDLNRW